MPEEKLNLYYLKKIEYDIDSRLRKKTKKNCRMWRRTWENWRSFTRMRHF